MKQQWTKRILAGVATLALALPIAFGLGQHTVKAAEASKGTPATQNVVLTKFGFDHAVTPDKHDTTQAPAAALNDWAVGATPLADVEFTVYDVTNNYWDAVNNDTEYKGDMTGAPKVGEAQRTDTDGKITFNNLSTTSNDHNAVYLFKETDPRAGYGEQASQTLWISLPAEADGDNNVYVYPKNEQVKTYYHQFIKMDGHTKNVLADAKFVIKKSDTEYLKLTDTKGDAVLDADGQQNVTGFVNVVKNNYRMTWVAKADATHFISDSKGIFGLDGFTEATKDQPYSAVETEAPKGYELAADTPFDADDQVSMIKDMPRGILPHTGGAGILAILAVGSALIAIAFVGIRKRQARA